MKILAIRGKNLASLAKLFAVDFTQEPLASTGIFAITGPTGAGKSTLLDALCLALYDDMPRLPREGYRGQNLPDVSGETIAPRDARNILRRGAAEGFAEVDFIGNDKIAYRAHWSVRRARIKSEGRLQNSELSLLRLDNEQLIGGARKTEVLAAIVERIGLSFEQFTRAVLLAQNEFSAFLKASDDKRAELLQTLTGTDVFAELSRRAYQRAKVAEQSLAGLRERLVNLKVLTSEERQAQELASQQAELRVQELELERSQLELQLQWQQQTAQLEQACQFAADLLAQAQEQAEAAAERKQFLGQLEKVQIARSSLDNLARIEDDLIKAQADLDNCAEQASHAALNYQITQQNFTCAQTQLKQKQEAYQALQPKLSQARQLDTVIQTLLPRQLTALNEQQAAQVLVESLQAAHLEQITNLARLTQQQAELKVWLAANAQWQGLAEHWPHWQSLLQQAQELLYQYQLGETDFKNLQEQSEQTLNCLEQTKLALDTRQYQLTQAEVIYEQKKIAANQYSLEALAQQRQILEDKRTQLQTAQQAWQSLQAAQYSLQRLTNEAEQLALAQAQCQETLGKLQIDLPIVERDCERAEHAWRLAEAACADQATIWRGQLKAGDACPVCGALEHPYAQEHPALDAVLMRLQQDYFQQRQALKSLETQLASEQTRFKQIQHQEQSLQQELVLVKTHCEQATSNWQRYANLVDAQEPSLSLQQALISVQQASLVVQDQEQTARQAQQQFKLAQEAWQQSQQEFLGIQEQFNAAEVTLNQLKVKQQYAQERQADFSKQLNSSLQQLDTGFAATDWQATWRGSPEDFLSHCQDQVKLSQAQQQQAETLRQQQAELALTQTQLSFQLQQAEQDLQRCQQQAGQLQQELLEQQTQRAGLLAGATVELVEASWQNELEQATAKLSDTQFALEQAQQVQIRAAAAIMQLNQLITQYQIQQHQVQQELAAHLQTFQQLGFDLELAELRSLLAYEQTWLESEREALQALQTTKHQAHAVLTERQAQLAQHLSLYSNPSSFTELQATQTQTLLALEAAQQTRQELMLVLREDQQRHEQASHIQAELDQLTQATRVWGQLNELIGSADGKKFRNFAQQYSLDVLLSYANRHLRDLSRRYTLRRVRESLALLVLDQDMGGEIRSVHSLSGGESFLVSLALALGLASLSSQRVKVESLFIDEGFGSLDADSLRVAMDALDQLQAQGRKVGVISHVQEMTERIAVQIQVRRLSGGQSYIKVSGY